MSAFSQSKKVLSAHELFKHRVKKDSSLPDRGGPKDFEPDGSWMQTKTLETLIQEKTAIISEPRVEKLKHLVEGVWDEEKKLVNLKRPGKFWMHMGFTDERRNWLYPEEALFLLETGNLEIFYNDIPMSIQEAYSRVLGSTITVEEYQVFAHLRRLGYVVLRYEKERVFTDYECKIKLDQYTKKKDIKSKNVKANEKSDENSYESSQQSKSELQEYKEKEQKSSYKDTRKRELELSEDELLSDAPDKKRSCPDDRTDSLQAQLNSESRDFYNTSSWSLCFNFKETSDTAAEDSVEKSSLTPTGCDESVENMFPDIADKESLTLQCSSEFIPSNGDTLDHIIFDVKEYREKNPIAPLTKEEKHEDERDRRLQDLTFSHSEWSKKKSKIEAKSWSELKQVIKAKVMETSGPTPLDHLWSGSITPLVKPEDAVSYEKILENLRIIQPATNDSLLPEPNSVPDDFKISFDVHLPDQKFRKSMPGIPNHRICVSSTDDGPPSLAVIQHLWSQCKDCVPLHWALVDSGEISFFVFNNSNSLETLR